MANLCFLAAVLGWSGFMTLIVGYCLRRMGVLRIRYDHGCLGSTLGTYRMVYCSAL